MVSSKWGDEKMFFKHNYMENDHKDNKCWIPHTPRFSIWGGAGYGSEQEGCPFSSKTKKDL